MVSLMRILQLNLNLSKYWIKLHTVYEEFDLEKSYKCLLYGQAFDGKSSSVRELMESFIIAHPGLDVTNLRKFWNVEHTGTKNEADEDFTDLGMNVLKLFVYSNG